jgi:hypothetical protein
LRTDCGKKFKSGMAVYVSGIQDGKEFDAEHGVVVLVEDAGYYGTRALIRFDRWKDGHGEDGNQWGFYENERHGWTIITLGEEPKVEAFAIGQFVKVVSEGSTYDGQEGEVVKSNYASLIAVKLDGAFSHLYFNPNELTSTDPAP